MDVFLGDEQLDGDLSVAAVPDGLHAGHQPLRCQHGHQEGLRTARADGEYSTHYRPDF